MQDIKIDLVYLWVNDKDEEWQAKRCYWAKKLGVANAEENNDCRYSNNDELKYSLRSAEMYAPWINKIFIVTDNQIPNWLDTNHPKIKIIDHKEIMPEECLPCFNSNAIETCIDNIPELSEYFLYANDDMFFADSVQPSDFFDKTGKPIVNLRYRDWLEPTNTHMQNILYTIDKYCRKFTFDKNLLQIEPSHCIDAYRKSYLKACKDSFQTEISDTKINKFRVQNQIQRIIFSMYLIEHDLGILKINPQIAEQEFQMHVENLYLRIEDISYMKMKLDTLTPKLLCINDTPYCSDNERIQLKQFLCQIFLNMPEWEKKEELCIEPFWKKEKSNAVVFSFNDEYCKYFAVTLQSIIINANDNDKYDIIVFNDNISVNNKKLLYKMLPPNFNLRFFDVANYIQTYFGQFKLKTLNNWSIEMYYRIFIPMLMNLYQKVLYLDSDMVINCNLNEIFKIDFDRQEILAVRDTATQIFHLSRNKERLKYMKNIMKIQNEENYFNSGMIMFNIKNIKLSEYRKKLFKAFEIEDLLYPDQDILNIIFENRVKFLETKWNLCCGDFVWDNAFINLVSNKDRQEYENALSNPKIIHYTSPRKPWNYKLALHFEEFWKYARQTFFYEEILFISNTIMTSKIIVESAKYTNLYLQINSGKRIVLWGASIFLEKFIKEYEITADNIIGIIDKNPNKKGRYLGQYQIYSPDELSKLKPEEIIITIVNSVQERAIEVRNYIRSFGEENIRVKTV